MGAVFAALVRAGLTAQVDFGFDLRKRERHGVGIAEFGERVDPRAAGIAEAEQFRDFVEGLARGIVHCAADERVTPRAVRRPREIKVRVTAGDDERQRRSTAGHPGPGSPASPLSACWGGRTAVLAASTPAEAVSRSFSSTA